MLRYSLQLLKISSLTLLFFTVLTGLFYPALITGVGELVFHHQAEGSITPQGSMLIGQAVSNPKYFWGRPSATSPFAYNAASSSGSNLAPDNPAFVRVVQARIDALHAVDPTNRAAIPVDLITASASGLDPDISPEAASYQVARIARLRNLPVELVNQLVAVHTTPRQLGFLGEPRVNVLQLNIDLDKLQQNQGKK